MLSGLRQPLRRLSAHARSQRRPVFRMDQAAKEAAAAPPGRKEAKHEDRRPGEDVRLSKALSYLLRHGAQKAGLDMRPDGFVQVNKILECKQLGKGVTVEKLFEITRNCAKQRFAITEIDGELYIRANQGHTVKVVDAAATYKRIEDASAYPVCVHGTTRKAWELIRTQGLSRMSRNEIHCAKGVPEGDVEVLSGIRGSAQILIYINLALCLERGIPWFESANGVLLTPGIDGQGILPPTYFLKVVDRKSGTELPLSNEEL